MAELKKLQILLPVEMHARLRAISDNITPAAFHIRQALTDYLDKQTEAGR